MSSSGRGVIVVGGGAGALGSALALAPAGHRVTLLDQDPLPATADPGEAFRAGRPGAPQSHQTHVFLARLQVLLRDRYPDVLDDLLALGCGRRSPLPNCLADAGVTIPEEVVESGLMYLTRWYRFPEGPKSLRDPKLGGDVGFLKYLGVPGDGETLSVTLAVPTRDRELRAALAAPDRFDLACRLLPGPDGFFADGPLEPLTGVKPMGGLLNRLRRFVDDGGRPLAVGVHAVGDAHTCTNPLYGRGCKLAMVQAVLLADAVAAHPDDPVARATADEAACAREVEPWYRSALELDRAGADPTGRARGAAGQAESDQGRAMAAVLVAAATDPDDRPGDGAVLEPARHPRRADGRRRADCRMAEVMAHPEDHPLLAPDGPTREALLGALASPEEAMHA
jgi:hypothetical protein